jgi:tetratricopeptide (TPR) repeat protein
MRLRLPRAAVRLVAAAATVLALGACTSLPSAPADPLEALRGAAADAAGGEAVGRWLLGELLVPGGTKERATAARQRLEGLGEGAKKGLFASLARAVDDEAHGRFRAAALAHLDAVEAARSSQHPDAHLVAWYASNHLLALRQGVADLWSTARKLIKETIDQPGNIGWRARGELVEWWTLDGYREEGAAATATAPSAATDPGAPPPSAFEAAAKLYGCVEKARMAGPFGHLAGGDHRVHYEAERAGPWPAVFPRDPLRLEVPRVHAVERVGCALRAPGAAPGIYYVETFVDLPADRELLIAAQGSFAIFVDDTEVLTRDTKVWGIWPRFAAHVRLEAGRHRVVARVAGPETSIRLQTPTGAPAGLVGSDDPSPPYAITRPEVLADLNALAPFLAIEGVPPQPGVPPPPAPAKGGAPARDPRDPISRMLAAYAAHIEGQDDLGAVLLEPLVKDPAQADNPDDRCGRRWNEKATGPALALAATLLEKDPIFPPDQARDCVKEARTRAAAQDPELWAPRFWLLLNEADKAGVADVASKVAALADHFPEVPDILRGLGAIYGRLGWKAEHHRAVLLAAERFPDDVDALHDLLRLRDEAGEVAAADALAARIRALDPDSEVDFERAVERRDFPSAIKELKRLGTIRKDRRDIAARIADLLTRAGASQESLAKLEAAVQKKPLDADARLSLADARLARGDRTALARALVDAIQAGAETSTLREAIDLVEGMTELTPYRIDGRKVIAEFEAQKPDMPGTAARVLDYSVIWIHADGSARMLEHEILAIQSREGIQEQAEQRPHGMLLKIRTLKSDGRVLDPEIVPGKETVTMPHLEIGDYIEVETLTTMHGDGQGGQRFEGPRWVFREAKIPYFRSEFITISPKNRPLDIETGGSVPRPDVSESGALVIRHWRVDKSPALPEEPAGAPPEEFVPNVRISWGINLKDIAARMVDGAADETPSDPRLVRVMQAILRGDASAGTSHPARRPSPEDPGGGPDQAGSGPTVSGGVAGTLHPAADGGAPVAPSAPQSPPKAALTTPSSHVDATAGVSVEEKARRIYRWVLANVEPGREIDGRRVVTGKSGVPTEAFLYLCRLAGIEAELGRVRDRLAAPPIGPMSEVESFGSVAVRLSTETGPRWMVVRDKFAPFGYMPSSLRGQPAIVLTRGAPRETTPSSGSQDGVTHEGTVDLASDGSARLEMEQRYEGKLAIALRTALQELPEARFKEIIESRLLPQSLPGARVISIFVKNLDELDAPLVLHMKLEMSSFARPRGGELLVSPLFPLHLAALTTLPARETPLYISENVATRLAVKLRIKLPEGARVTTELSPHTVEDEDRFVKVTDHVEPGFLVLDRVMDLPAGRIQPAGYLGFQAFARSVDAALHRDVSVTLSAR